MLVHKARRVLPQQVDYAERCRSLFGVCAGFGLRGGRSSRRRGRCWIDPPRTLPHRQPVQRTGSRLQVGPPHVQIDHGRGETAVSQQPADGQQIDSRFQQSRRITVSQRVRRDGLVDPRQRRRHLAGLLDRGARQGNVERLAGKEERRRSHLFPVRAEFRAAAAARAARAAACSLCRA